MSVDWEHVFAPKGEAEGSVLVGLLGAGIGASRTPHMHMREAAAQGFPCDYRLIDIDGSETPPDLGQLLFVIDAVSYNGINVTFPFKQTVISHLDELSAGARAVGAVNTVVFRNGRRIGHNTDHAGFRDSLRRGLPDAPRGVVLLLGAGGAGGAVAQALVDEGVGTVLVHDVDGGRAAALAARIGDGRAEVVADLAVAAGRGDGIVNATPVGIARLPSLPLPDVLVDPRHWVADIVYFPLETELLALARARAVLPGSGMAVFQAVRAFELFTGHAADPARMWAAFNDAG